VLPRGRVWQAPDEASRYVMQQVLRANNAAAREQRATEFLGTLQFSRAAGPVLRWRRTHATSLSRQFSMLS
jgi:hypothetical protein